MNIFQKITLAFALSAITITSAGAQNGPVEEGLRLIDFQKYEAARKVFRELSVTDPGNAEYQYYLGEIYFQLEEPEQARSIFEKVGTLNAESPYSLLAQARIKMEDKDLEAAKKLAQQAINAAPKKEEIYIQASRVFIVYETRDADHAINILTPAMEKFKKSAGILLALGDAYMSMSPSPNLNEAIKYYDRGNDLDPKSARAKLRVGQIYVKVRNYEAAMEYFDQAFAIDSNYAPVRKERAEIFYLFKSFEKAKTEYERYLEIVENDINARSRYAAFLYLTKEYDKSAAEIKEIQKIDTSSNVLFRIAGYDNYELGRYDEAKNYLYSYLRRTKPERQIAADYEYYAKTLSKLGEDSVAIVYYLMAFDKDTTRADLRREAARTLTRSKRYNDAIVIYRQMLESGEDAPTYLDLGLAYLSSGQFDSASSCFGKVIELKPDNFYGYIFKAKAESNLDPQLKTAAAKPYYEKYLEIVTASGDAVKQKRYTIEANSYLGAYYVQRNDNAQACQYWKTVKELDPQNAQAAQFFKVVKCQ